MPGAQGRVRALPPARDLACATCSVEGVRPWILPLGFTVETPLITLCSAAEGGALRLSMLARSSATSGTTLGNLAARDDSLSQNCRCSAFLGSSRAAQREIINIPVKANICHACERELQTVCAEARSLRLTGRGGAAQGVARGGAVKEQGRRKAGGRGGLRGFGGDRRGSPNGEGALGLPWPLPTGRRPRLCWRCT